MLNQKMTKRTFGALAMLSAVLIWSVGALAQAPMGIEGNVTVQNGVANPVPVIIDATNPVAVVVEGEVAVGNQEMREPYQRAISRDDWEEKNGVSFNLDIPSDKKLTVQTVSISALVESSQDVRAILTSQGSGAGLSAHPILLTKQGTFNGLDLYVGAMSLTTYAAGSGGLLVSVIRNSDTGFGANIRFSVSGYLVDTIIP